MSRRKGIPTRWIPVVLETSSGRVLWTGDPVSDKSDAYKRAARAVRENAFSEDETTLNAWPTKHTEIELFRRLRK